MKHASIPPGAVGGIYGSGCFHFSSNSSASCMSSLNMFSRSPRPRVIVRVLNIRAAAVALLRSSWRRKATGYTELDLARCNGVQPSRERA